VVVPVKFGKQVGGDILSNKKTFLIIHALEVADATGKKELETIMQGNEGNKVEKVLQIFRNNKVDDWAKELKDQYLQKAFQHLEDIAVQEVRKQPLQELAEYLLERER